MPMFLLCALEKTLDPLDVPPSSPHWIHLAFLASHSHWVLTRIILCTKPLDLVASIGALTPFFHSEHSLNLRCTLLANCWDRTGSPQTSVRKDNLQIKPVIQVSQWDSFCSIMDHLNLNTADTIQGRHMQCHPQKKKLYQCCSFFDLTWPHWIEILYIPSPLKKKF